MNRTIIVGDIHGCYDELRDLLDRVGPAADDRIIALGDIVNRGPKSENVLEFFRDQPNAESIMGNHEYKHLNGTPDRWRPPLSQRIVRHQLAERYDTWRNFMATFPRHVDLPEAILVHGMLEPDLDLADQRDDVVIGAMGGDEYMHDTYPHPWYDLYTGPKPVIAGHHDYHRTRQPLIRPGLVYAIDTGCVHGGRLTALILPDFQLVSVPARANYWASAREQYRGIP